jgi:glucose-1-phosphate thymidylyltransferase
MDKAVILARGLGTRMRRDNPRVRLTAQQQQVATTGVKALMPVGRPFLDYVLAALAQAGYRRICLVIGPEHEELRRYYGEELRYERLKVEFAVQEKPLGTADAVLAAQGFAGEEPFLMINSDNYYPVEALAGLAALEGLGLAAFERSSMLEGSNIPAERLTRFAVVEAGEDGFLKRIVEKPGPEVLENLPQPVGMSMNCWRFDRRIFPACRAIRPSPRGELELPDAVQYAVDEMGARFRVLHYQAAVLDLSSREDVAGVAQRLAGKEVRL